MVRSVFKRFGALVLSLALMLTMMPLTAIPVNAASGILDIGINGLSASYDEGTWSVNSGTITGSVTTKKEGCALRGYTFTATKGTLTLKNESESKAVLKYRALCTNGDGAVSASGNNQVLLEPGDTASIAITSYGGGDDTSEVTINNISFEPVTTVNVTFMPPEHGSYKVDGEQIITEKTISKVSDQTFNLEATPEPGYRFVWWKNENETKLSNSSTSLLYISRDETITAAFIPSDAAIFDVDGTSFTDLNEATAYATSTGKEKIVLAENGTLPSGNYSIPKGKLLLIPFDDAYTSVTTNEHVIYNKYDTPSAFKTLTLAEGAHIDVMGSISLASKMSSKGQLGGTNGVPTGPDGRIRMNKGSSISVKSGGNLYAYGFISGEGSVLAESGSKVYENFQVKDWRGGSATSSIYSYAFPFSQYYVQNIEVPLTLEPGATEICNTAVNASSTAQSAQVTFIGTDGMFQISSGTLTKEYKASLDRLFVLLDGSGALNSVSLSGIPVVNSIDSTNFELPINSNITVKCLDGSNVTIGQKLKLLPSAEIDIEEGSTATIADGTSVYLYDKDDWGNFTGNGKLYVVGYSAANGTTAKRNANSLVDARIDVNGTLNVNGSLFTTNGGANIISSNGTGKVIFNKKPTANAAIKEMANNSTETTVEVTAAKLHNGQRYAGTDDEYTPTADLAAGTEVPYSKVADKWGEAAKITVSFDANDGGTGSMDAAEVESGAEYPIPDNGFTPAEGKSFTGWNTKADGTGKPYAAGATATLTEDTTLYAQWATSTYNVTFNTNGHGTAPDTQTVEYGQKAAEPADPTATGWKFGGWYTDPECTNAYDFDTPVKEALTLYAKWTEDTATVTFMSQDGNTVLGTAVVAIGEKPSYNAVPPAKEGTAEYEYAFAGWATSANQEEGSTIDELPPVTGDINYYAAFSKEKKKYTIVFQNADGKILQSSEVAYGETPVYDRDTPTKAADETYTYEFAGWDNQIVSVTGPATYTATYTPTDIEYTVVFYKEDGTTKISEKSYHYGDKVEVPKAPEKPATAEKTYIFDKWEPSVQTTVTGNAEYTATYTEEINKYNVRWVSDGETVETDSNVEYGSAPSFNGSQPAKEKTAQYSYEFVGWNTDSDASTGVDLSDQTITGHTTYYAIFKSTVNSYTVTFVDEDGTTVLDQQSVEYGKMPVYKGETPEKEGTAEFAYEFSGWTPELAEVTAEATYKATYSKTVKTYSVKFMDEDGETVLAKQMVEYGKTPIYNGETPTKKGSAEYSYEFSGWTPELSAVSGEATYTAVFKKVKNKYTVKFVDEDGTTVLDEQLVEYGSVPEYKGADPEKQATAQYSYTFTGWDKEIAEVTGEAVYKATYSEELRKYSIRFLDDDGTTVLDKQTVEYGKTPEYAGDKPKKAETAWVTYDFIGWSPELAAVTGDADYTASYKENKKLGWITDDGKTYFVKDDGELAKGTFKTTAKDGSHDATFAFDPETGEFRKDLTGVYTDGTDYYWVDNGEVRFEEGLVRISETQEYYYFGEDGKAYRGETKWVEKNNDLLPQWDYTFGDDGIIVHEDVDIDGPTKVGEETFYYIDGIRVHMGLVKDGDDYYYYKRDGLMIRDSSYWISRLNGLDAEDDRIAEKSYQFDETGKMILSTIEDKNGIYEEDGSLYYYEDGKRTYAGLIEIDGSYYYVKTSGEVVHGRDYWITKTNGLMAEKSYTFDDEGKMVIATKKNGIIEEDGKLFYYKDDQKTYAGLFELEGYFYYAKTSGEIVCGRSYWVTKTNGLMPEKSYTFDETGKMTDPDVVSDTQLNGIVKDGNDMFYYVDGVKTYVGLIEIDGDFYYVKTDGSVVHGRKYWITKTNGLVKEGSYTFDNDGKMVR